MAKVKKTKPIKQPKPKPFDGTIPPPPPPPPPPGDK